MISKDMIMSLYYIEWCVVVVFIAGQDRTGIGQDDMTWFGYAPLWRLHSL